MAGLSFGTAPNTNGDGLTSGTPKAKDPAGFVFSVLAVVVAPKVKPVAGFGGGLVDWAPKVNAGFASLTGVDLPKTKGFGFVEAGGTEKLRPGLLACVAGVVGVAGGGKLKTGYVMLVAEELPNMNGCGGGVTGGGKLKPLF